MSRHLWRILQSGKDLARTWQGLGIFTLFETAWGRFEGFGGILEALRGHPEGVLVASDIIFTAMLS